VSPKTKSAQTLWQADGLPIWALTAPKPEGIGAKAME